MNGCEIYIYKLAEKLPEMCSVQDLINVGIYRTEQAAYYARRKKQGPDYFQMSSRQVLYPKEGVIQYLKQHQHPMAHA